MGNAFMAAAEKNRKQQEGIERAEPVAAPDKSLVTINVRIPKSLHKKAQMHRVETGENVTRLINRLLQEELS